MSEPVQIRIPKALTNTVKAVVAREHLTERGAILYLLRLGAERHAVELYRDGKVTMGQAATLANQTTRDMIEVMPKHGVRGNLTMEMELEAHETMRRLRKRG